MIAGILWPIIFSDDTCENTKTECQREGERAGSEVDNIPPDLISRANKTEHKSVINNFCDSCLSKEKEDKTSVDDILCLICTFTW